MSFRDPNLPVEERVKDLLGQLTLAEKVGLLHQHQAPITRLGIGPFRTGTEALHGLAWLGEATVFPQAVGLGATWDPDLVQRVGAAVGDEVRAHPDAGLNVWAPVVNPLRDPRWGRNEEGYSEDPWLTGMMGRSYAQGLRGDHPRHLKTAPTVKHFLGYNNEINRVTTSSNLSPRVLHEYELPAYRPAIESGAAVAVMASYNLVNGVPAHVTPLINEHLRLWTQQEIFVVSDAHAPSNLAEPEQQAHFPDHATSHAAAIKAGIDSFTDQGDRSEVTIGRIIEALRRGLLTEADIDRAAGRALLLRMRLGEFDSDGYPTTVPDLAMHSALAREAARRSIVLLKRDAGPLAPAAKVAVIGPLADQLMCDWYSGEPPYRSTVRSGLSERLGEVAFSEGVDRIALRRDDGTYLIDAQGFDVFDWGSCEALRCVSTGGYLTVNDGVLSADSPGPHGWKVHETFRLIEDGDDGMVLLRHELSGHEIGRFIVELLRDGVRDAANAARDADAVVVVLGNHPLVNGREEEDRPDLALPRAQERLLRAVTDERTVLVLMSSYPYAITWADAHVPTIIWSSHGGQESGRALADVLFGEAEPSGRLPQTWYRSHTELPDLLDYDIIANDATYLYYRGTPLYPFGHGLSWTDFDYRDLRVSRSDDEITVTVDVVNVGHRVGEEVVQLYTHQQRSRVKQPLRKLRGFTHVRLAPGERQAVTLSFDVSELSFWDVTTGRFVVETAHHKVMAGRSAVDIRCCATIFVEGERIGPRRAGSIRAIDCDESFGMVLVAGDATESTEKGAWLWFGATDLTDRREVTIAHWGEPGEVLLRVGDPLDGPVLDAEAVASAGVVDLYLVCEVPGIVVSGVEFT